MADRAWIPALSIASVVGGCFLEAVAFILILSRLRSPCIFEVCDVLPSALPIIIAVIGLALIVPGGVGLWVLRDARTR